MDWMRLKSGTDIRGLAIKDGEKEALLTSEVGIKIGMAFAQWIDGQRERGETATIAVGCDSRVTGESLKAAMILGLRAGGVRVLDCGLCTTPAMFMSTLLAGATASVMVTASHMPWKQNGYKFFTASGGLSSDQIRQVIQMAETAQPGKPVGGVQNIPFLAHYSDFLKRMAFDALGEMPLAGLHVVVDAGNGAGGFYAALLASLGAKIEGSQFLDPDGRFPNHIPNPELPEAMSSVSEAVLRSGADMGVIFDADCDRAALVDGSGLSINRNRLIAMISDVLLREHPSATIVTDSVTSAGLKTFIEKKGGVLRRFKRGYQNVIGEARRLCDEGIDCPLAMETSGHAALRENRFLDDGMYLMTRLIIEAQRLKRQNRPLVSLIDGLEEPVESDEMRFPIRAQDFHPIGEAVLADVAAMAREAAGWAIDPKGCEGIRVNMGSDASWFLLRLSVHDPLLVLNVESNRAGCAMEMFSALKPVLAKTGALDLSALEARLNN